MCGGAETVKARAMNAAHRPCEAKQARDDLHGNDEAMASSALAVPLVPLRVDSGHRV